MVRIKKSRVEEILDYIELENSKYSYKSIHLLFFSWHFRIFLSGFDLESYYPSV